MKMFKNVVIISIDSLRADGINYNRDLIYGKGNHKPIKTPSLDEFARKGTTSIRAYSTNTYTTSAHASLFTGEYPALHGIRAFFDWNQRLNPKCRTLAEELNDLGFQTFFYSDIKELFSEMNIWRGFKIKTYERLNWLWNSIEEFKKDRNFVFMHLFDVHEPYLYIEDKSIEDKRNTDYYEIILQMRKKLGIKSKTDPKLYPHKSWQEIRQFIMENNLDHKEYLSEYYYKGIETFDKNRFAEIINRLHFLGLNQDNSLFVILSDHGEGRTEIKNSKNFSHGGELTEETLRIPFLTNAKMNPLKVSFSIKDVKRFVSFLLKSKSCEECFVKKEVKYAEFFRWNQTTFVNLDTNKLDREIKTFISQKALIFDGYKIIIEFFPKKLVKIVENKNDYKKYICSLYKYLLGRFSDPSGFKGHLKRLTLGEISNLDLFQIFLNSEEFKKRNFISLIQTDKLQDKIMFKL